MNDNLFSLPLRVYYEDTDAAGVMYHAAYVCFFERARTEFLRQIGFDHQTLYKTLGVLFTVRTLTVEYLRPAYLDDRLHINVDIIERGRVYMDFAQHATRESTIIATAQTRVVCVSGSPVRACPIPTAITDKISINQK